MVNIPVFHHQYWDGAGGGLVPPVGGTGSYPGFQIVPVAFFSILFLLIVTSERVG